MGQVVLPSTLGTDVPIDDFQLEVFERLKIPSDKITGDLTLSFLRSANLELTSWQGRVPLEWLRKRGFLTMYAGQATYSLPTNITRVINVVIAQPKRQNLTGTAGSSAVAGGSPSNCFNPVQTAGCTLAAPDGYISYDYGINQPQSIQYVGITPLASKINYTLDIQYSFDNVNWHTALQTPTTEYYGNQTRWWVVENTLNARAWRILETNNAVLAIQQIYFSIPTGSGPGSTTGDRTLGQISLTEYMTLANKNALGTPSCYAFSEQINPYLVLWVTPDISQIQAASGILYDAYFYVESATNLLDQFKIPQRFYDALAAGIAARLAIKHAPAEAQLLTMSAQQAFMEANKTEITTVPLRIQPNLRAYRN